MSAEGWQLGDNPDDMPNNVDELIALANKTPSRKGKLIQKGKDDKHVYSKTFRIDGEMNRIVSKIIQQRLNPELEIASDLFRRGVELAIAETLEKYPNESILNQFNVYQQFLRLQEDWGTIEFGSDIIKDAEEKLKAVLPGSNEEKIVRHRLTEMIPYVSDTVAFGLKKLLRLE